MRHAHAARVHRRHRRRPGRGSLGSRRDRSRRRGHPALVRARAPLGPDEPQRAGPGELRRGASGPTTGGARARRASSSTRAASSPSTRRATTGTTARSRSASRDLFGEIVQVARTAGLAVLARMDSTRTYEDVFRAHPDWFARDARGQPFKSGDLYTVCVNGPWVEECVPAILREIAGRYRPDGFTDNSWSGLGQKQVCYCEHCRAGFRRAARARAPVTAWTGTTPRTAHGSAGATRGAPPCGTRTTASRTRPAAPTATGSACARATRRTMCGDFRDPSGDLVALADRDARLADAAAGRGLPVERRGRPRAARRARLGPARAREPGPLPRADAADVPQGGEAGGRGAAVVGRGHGRGHPAVVAPPRRAPGGPPPAAHGGASVAVARGERGVPRGPQAGRDGRGRVVRDEHRLVRPRRVGRPHGPAVRGRRRGARARTGCRGAPCTPTTSRATRGARRARAARTSPRSRMRRRRRCGRSWRAGGGLVATGESSRYDEEGRSAGGLRARRPLRRARERRPPRLGAGPVARRRGRAGTATRTCASRTDRATPCCRRSATRTSWRSAAGWSACAPPRAPACS